MNEQAQTHPDYGFVIGLLTGTLVGAGLMMWLAPRMASELRHQVAATTRTLQKRASRRYQQAGHRVSEAIDDIGRTGRGLRHDVADAVAHGAHEVERYATSVGSDRP
jgi:gas vesicle protein